ncbi:hypothetical protein [Streptomyces sp. NBC_00151]|jgi:hypothetical protein|uniref:hypothetical protein n=1 Tax=Streptomyces sp. NBC_00151 TaxID=2975669 RepID=UPI002DDBD515|nr:hypothetical protein [Streptomyces sp. NBC_00151]WRZ39746.1 hypothetical protein OG915_17845 [Streptomyces sp. NBC_00151]
MKTNRAVMRSDWALVLLGVIAVALVPWMVLLVRTLPASTEVRNWQVAWVGLDVLMATGCAATAVLGLRRDPRARLTASATAAVAVLDAWFDITTAQPGAPLVQALACAVAEAGLACACVFLALSKSRAPRDEQPELVRPRGRAPESGAFDRGE